MRMNEPTNRHMAYEYGTHTLCGMMIKSEYMDVTVSYIGKDNYARIYQDEDSIDPNPMKLREIVHITYIGCSSCRNGVIEIIRNERKKKS